MLPTPNWHLPWLRLRMHQIYSIQLPKHISLVCSTSENEDECLPNFGRSCHLQYTASEYYLMYMVAFDS